MNPLRVYMSPAGHAGMALYTYKLANALAQKGVRITLFVDNRYELDYLPCEFKKINVLSSKYVSLGSNQPRIVRIANILLSHFYNLHKFCSYARKDRPEIVHIQPLFYLLDWYMMRQLDRIGARLILTIHDVLPHSFYSHHFIPIELAILQYIYDKADKLIVHAESNKEQLLHRFSIDEDKVVVIPHGEYCVTGMFNEISRNGSHSEVNLASKDKVVLFFGHIRKGKGIDILLEAFDRVAENFSNVVLIIAGSVIQRESFREYGAFISQMKHGSRVRCFIGYVDHNNLSAFFEPADMVVLPYVEFSAQSGVLHLAQGFGKPVIVTDVGGLPEAVQDRETGLVVHAGDVEALVKGISYLLENERAGRQMGQRAREVATERFSWEKIARSTLEQVYEDGH